MTEQSSNISHEKFLAGKHTDILLEIGSTLLTSGAHSERINRNLNRIGQCWGYDVDIFFSYTGLIVTIQKKGDAAVYATRHKRISKHGVNFKAINEISLLSWRVKEEDLTPGDVAEELEEIKSIPHYSEFITIAGVGLACAALCLISKGDWRDAAFAFVAASTGFFVRRKLDQRRFNIMICILTASFVTSMIAGMDVLYHIGSSPEKALATSVLYLIPGVPLINSVIDLIEGYIPTALARGMYGGFVLLSIAVGMSLSILLIGLSNF